MSQSSHTLNIPDLFSIRPIDFLCRPSNSLFSENKSRPFSSHFPPLKGDPSRRNWTVLDFYGIVKAVIIVAFATMITLWIGLPWFGCLIICRPLVESCSVLHQLERWVIRHRPPENSASSTLCYKFTSGSATVRVHCHSATDWQLKLSAACFLGSGRCGKEWEQVKDQGSVRHYITNALNHLL